MGAEYTVAHTRVGSWKTDVALMEVPEEMFNSVFFEDVIREDFEINVPK